MNKNIITRLHRSKHSPYIYINNVKYTFDNLDPKSQLCLQYCKLNENIYYEHKNNIIYKLRFVSKIDRFLMDFILLLC